MKSFWKSMSITKLVFLILALVLAFNTIWNTIHGLDNQIFETIISMTFSFYFAQKGLTYTETDSLVRDDAIEEKESCVGFDLDSKEEDKDDLVA